MPTPAPRPTPHTCQPPHVALLAQEAPGRSWLVPTAAAAVLVAVGAWLLAPTATDVLAAEPPVGSSTTAPAGPAPSRDEPDEASSTATEPAPATSTSTSATSSVPPPSPSPQLAPTVTKKAPTDTGEVPPEEEWRPVAEGFAADFATPGDDWAQRLATWTTAELAQAYAYTDPTRQPAADLAALEVTEEGPTSVRALATYAGQDDLAVDVQLVLTPAGWRVSSASPAVPGG